MIDEPRALRILDALLVGAVALQVPVVVLLVGDPEAPIWQPWAFAAAVLLMLALWVTWRRSQHRTTQHRTTQELVLAQERTRAAAELHDGLGHRLTGIGLLLDGARRLQQRDPEQAWASVAEVRQATGEALQEMRTWVRALSPVPLSELSDCQAFQAIAERFRGTGLAVDVDADVEDLGTAQALVVYRCVQEGLTNVVRHSGAEHAHLAVRRDGSGVRLELTDDGRGVGGAAEGFGLTAMRARVEDLGGSLTSTDPPEGGRRLAVVVPDQPVAAGPTSSVAASGAGSTRDGRRDEPDAGGRRRRPGAGAARDLSRAGDPGRGRGRRRGG